MIDLDSLLQKAQTSANSVNTDSKEDWKSETSNGNTFDDIFKDQLESKRAAKDGKTLPDPNTKTNELEARVLAGGAEILLAGSDPTTESITKYALAQGIDPEIMNLLMSDTRDSNIRLMEDSRTGSQPNSIPVLAQSQLGSHLGFQNSSQLIAQSPSETSLSNSLKLEMALNTDADDQREHVQTEQSKNRLKIEQFFIASNGERASNEKTNIKLDPINLKVDVEELLLGGGKSSASQSAIQNVSRLDTSGAPISANVLESKVEMSSKSLAEPITNRDETSLVRRQEQYLDASRRLTQAIGERLSAQIVKGAWKVEMDLHPKSLGRIEIKLEMRNGQLEAHFNSSQNVTRDLLQESFTKLKDVLAEHGIDSAYVGLGTGEDKNSDGKPTDQSPDLAENEHDESHISEVANQNNGSSDGLDIQV
jgi:flagellar hook-length control protein FliK